MLFDRHGAASPPFDSDFPPQEADSDWAEDMAPEEDDSVAEDSVSTSDLSIKTIINSVPTGLGIDSN